MLRGSAWQSKQINKKGKHAPHEQISSVPRSEPTRSPVRTHLRIGRTKIPGSLTNAIHDGDTDTAAYLAEDVQSGIVCDSSSGVKPRVASDVRRPLRHHRQLNKKGNHAHNPDTLRPRLGHRQHLGWRGLRGYFILPSSIPKHPSKKAQTMTTTPPTCTTECTSEQLRAFSISMTPRQGHLPRHVRGRVPLSWKWAATPDPKQSLTYESGCSVCASGPPADTAPTC